MRTRKRKSSSLRVKASKTRYSSCTTETTKSTLTDHPRPLAVETPQRLHQLRQRVHRLPHIPHVRLRSLREGRETEDGRAQVLERQLAFREDQQLAKRRVTPVVGRFPRQRHVFEQHAAVQQQRQRLQESRGNALSVDERGEGADERGVEFRLVDEG